MRFGFHISIAGGFAKAIEKAQALECRTIQLFSHNPRGWSYKELNEDEVKVFKKLLVRSDITPVFVHMPYLPNLASLNGTLYEKSIHFLCVNLRRAHILGASYLVVHPGSRGDRSADEGIERIARAINNAFERVENSVMVLLENTAGQGTEIGSTFNQLKMIIKAVTKKKRLGICLDSAHAFAAGYDLSTKKGLEGTLNEFDRLIGIDRLQLLHLNDSRTPLGSHTDRHWHIGEGCIELDGFRLIVNHPLLKNLPGIMETPKKTEGDDRRNMQTIKKLVVGRQKI